MFNVGRIHKYFYLSFMYTTHIPKASSKLSCSSFRSKDNSLACKIKGQCFLMCVHPEARPTTV